MGLLTIDESPDFFDFPFPANSASPRLSCWPKGIQEPHNEGFAFAASSLCLISATTLSAVDPCGRVGMSNLLIYFLRAVSSTSRRERRASDLFSESCRGEG
jgi:hypothetical protein